MQQGQRLAVTHHHHLNQSQLSANLASQLHLQGLHDEQPTKYLQLRSHHHQQQLMGHQPHQPPQQYQYQQQQRQQQQQQLPLQQQQQQHFMQQQPQPQQPLNIQQYPQFCNQPQLQQQQVPQPFQQQFQNTYLTNGRGSIGDQLLHPKISSGLNQRVSKHSNYNEGTRWQIIGFANQQPYSGAGPCIAVEQHQHQQEQQQQQQQISELHQQKQPDLTLKQTQQPQPYIDQNQTGASVHQVLNSLGTGDMKLDVTNGVGTPTTNGIRQRIGSVSGPLPSRMRSMSQSGSPVPFLTRSTSFSMPGSQRSSAEALGSPMQISGPIVMSISPGAPQTLSNSHHQAVIVQQQQQQHQQQHHQQQQQQQHFEDSFGFGSDPYSSWSMGSPSVSSLSSPPPYAGSMATSIQSPGSSQAQYQSPMTCQSQKELQSESQGNVFCSSSNATGEPLNFGINLEQYISKRNERERSRVRNVNDAFDNLKNSLPLDVDKLTKRMSKVEILRTAITYIKNLEEVLSSRSENQSEDNCLNSQQ